MQSLMNRNIRSPLGIGKFSRLLIDMRLILWSIDVICFMIVANWFMTVVYFSWLQIQALSILLPVSLEFVWLSRNWFLIFLLSHLVNMALNLSDEHLFQVRAHRSVFQAETICDCLSCV